MRPVALFSFVIFPTIDEVALFWVRSDVFFFLLLDVGELAL